MNNQFIGNIYKTVYGNYRTRKFTDIFPNVESFLNLYNDSGIPTTISSQNATTLYYLLYSKYGNSSIANSDENQFNYKLLSIIYMYGPSWEKRLEVQSQIRNLTEEDLITGAKNIANHAYNPSTEPSTSSLEELTAINEQHTSQFKKSKLDAYNLLWNLIATDVTEEFLSKFKYLFLVVVEPQDPLYYITEEE